ncbi:hypothetical protein GCM10010124_16840 [Pilimelia terevasa]|uniref:Uncharacterized protein n=1 Tax=Pilimelia terevasa TaxID=53372 RepID=A0A8J3FH71_9ACTN|nr:hypothetical protein [Pilimelia terevasa]GGK24937.1 hypothetical protein GCM10010124_16840 [Pilimelia terevasa]
MQFEFLGKGPGSGQDGCPSLFKTDRDTYLVQGWKVKDAEGLDIPEGEAVVEIPARMLTLFQGRS